MNQNEPTISHSPHIKETPSSQMPEPPADTQPTTTKQPQKLNSPTITDETLLHGMPTTNDDNTSNSTTHTVTEPTQSTPHPIMELTIDEFPALLSRTPTLQPET